MPDERQEAHNDARYGRRQHDERRGGEAQGEGWPEERRPRQRDERQGNEGFRAEGYGDEERWGGQGDDWRTPPRRGAEDWHGAYGGWERARGVYGGPDYTRGGGFGGPQDAYTRGIQDEGAPAGRRGGFGALPGEWPSGYGGEQYGRGADRRGEGRFGGERPGSESRGQRSFRGFGPKGYQRSDERLKEVVCEKLCDDDRVDASEISIEVQNGEVTLQGHVPERSMKYCVEELIEQCGVHEINNHLRVQAQSPWSSQPGQPESSGAEQGAARGSGYTDKANSEGRGAGSAQQSGTGKP